MTMKKGFPIILVVILLFAIYIFNRAPDEYPFPNAAEPVVSVELIHNQNPEGFGIDEDNFDILCVLDKEAGESFLNRVQELQTNRRHGGPFWGYGPYFARVTYGNGTIEILGCSNLELIEKGDMPSGFGSYSFNHDDFMEVFVDYYPVDHFNGK